MPLYFKSIEQMCESNQFNLPLTSQLIIGVFNIACQVDIYNKPYHSTDIVCANATSRFLLEDGTLVIANTTNVPVLYQALTDQEYDMGGRAIFYTGGHAQIHLTCNHCNEGKPYSMYYDLNGPVGKQDHPFVGPTYPNSVIFYLTAFQMQALLNSLDTLYQASIDGKYKYVYPIHNCAAIMYDSWFNAGFQHDFTLYWQDFEILSNWKDDAMMLALHHRLYPVNDYLDPYRNKVHAFAVSVLPKVSTETWGAEHCQADPDRCVRSLPILSIMDSANDFIAHRLYNISKSNQEAVLPFCMANLFKEIFPLQQQQAILQYLDSSLEVEDLYYRYVKDPQIAEWNYLQLYQPRWLNTALGKDLIRDICLDFLQGIYSPDGNDLVFLPDPIAKIIGRQIDFAAQLNKPLA